MRNLLFNSLLMPCIFLVVSCSYSNQAGTDGISEDTVILQTADTNQATTSDTIQPDQVKSKPAQNVEGKSVPGKTVVTKGEPVSAGTTSTDSTKVRTTSPHPGAIKNPGANQSETDSIKKAKTKGKKKG